MSRRRTLRALVLVATIGVANTECAAAARGAAREPVSAPPRYERTACPPKLPALENAECGFLVVPENRTKRHSRSIRIAVAVLPPKTGAATGEPLVYLAGGPGGVPFLEAPKLADAGLNRDRKLILVQQRGTLYSEPALTCPNIDEFAIRLLGLRYDADSTRDLHLAATRACRQRLIAAGVELGAYNTTENATDLADLRRALGIRAWNVYGVSYGTDLAQVYLRDHPEGIRSVVLDSTVPTMLASFAGFWTNARAGLDDLSNACGSQAACRQTFPDVKSTFTHLVAKLERQPAHADVTNAEFTQPKRVVLDGGALVNWLVTMSFFTPQFVDVPSWIVQLANGKPERIAASRALVTPPGLVGYGLTYGVFCSEWAPFDSQAAVDASGRRAFPSYAASILAQAPQAPFIFDDCRIWNVPKVPAASRRPVTSRVPTLILAGDFDGVTSLHWARAVARGLANARVIVIPGAGHFVVPQSRCAQTVVASFLAQPAKPDTRCAATLEPSAFTIAR